MTIILYMTIVLIGFILSKFNIIPKFILKRMGLLQSICLFSLLLVMGINIGINEDIFYKIPTLGFKAFIISVTSVFMSIIFVKAIYRRGGK